MRIHSIVLTEVQIPPAPVTSEPTLHLHDTPCCPSTKRSEEPSYLEHSRLVYHSTTYSQASQIHHTKDVHQSHPRHPEHALFLERRRNSYRKKRQWCFCRLVRATQQVRLGCLDSSFPRSRAGGYLLRRLRAMCRASNYVTQLP